MIGAPIRIARVHAGDVVAQLHCMVIDALAFPHASASFGTLVNDPDARLFVARGPLDGDDRVLGFCAVARDRRGLHVAGIAVLPEARRRGVGRALLRRAIAARRELRVAPVVLCVSTGNAAAIALYQSEGFVVRRRLDGYYRGAVDGSHDALEMRLG